MALSTSLGHYALHYHLGGFLRRLCFIIEYIYVVAELVKVWAPAESLLRNPSLSPHPHQIKRT